MDALVRDANSAASLSFLVLDILQRQSIYGRIHHTSIDFEGCTTNSYTMIEWLENHLDHARWKSSFVIWITTRFAPSTTFLALCELLMDQDMRIQKAWFLQTKIDNVVSKPNLKTVDLQSPSTKSLSCQICSRKGHEAINCYTRLNVIHFQPTHDQELWPNGPSGVSRNSTLSTNLVATFSNAMSMWYLDLGAISHITNEVKNI